MKNFDVKEAVKAQKELQEKKGYPDFAPSNGVCWSCSKNIYTEHDKGTFKTGITVEKASTVLITGCPHCNRSYCD